MKRIFLILTVIGLSLLCLSCERKLKQSTGPPLILNPPPTPKNIIVEVGDKTLQLSWSVDSLNGIARFKIYRSDSAGVNPKLYDSTATATTSYSDLGLKNGHEYFYQVSSVASDNLEGYKSVKVSAAPNLYSVVINNANKYTNTRNVTISLTGASNTRHLILSEDSLFGDASWQTFSGSKSFTLSFGDGPKYVYAKFRDQDGNETFNLYWDDILLDTQASIVSVTENTLGQTKTAGNIIHFTINAGETEGTAKVDLGTIRDLQLYDDGTHGDGFVNDGLYELDYVVPNDVEVKDAVVTGKFTDAAGNQAPSKTASGRVTIVKAPEPVNLFTPIAVTGSYSSITLNWSASSEPDFASYRIYRSTSAGVNLNSTLVANLTGKSTTIYTDTALSKTTWYHYRIFVFDANNLSSGSNEDSAQTNANTPPDTVQLFAPSNITSSSMTLFWTQSNATDFYAYQLYRANSPAVNSDSTLLTTITSRTTVSYTDTGLDANTTYYYRLYVVDKSGLSTATDSVGGTTLPNLPPEPVVLSNPTRVDSTRLKLNWTQNNDPDFASYRVFRSDTTKADSTGQLVTIINQAGTTSYTDENLIPRKTYYYLVRVYDKEGLFSRSNEVSGTP